MTSFSQDISCGPVSCSTFSFLFLFYQYAHAYASVVNLIPQINIYTATILKLSKAWPGRVVTRTSNFPER